LSRKLIEVVHARHLARTTLCLKKRANFETVYSSKLQGSILMTFGRSIQNTLE